MIIIITTTTITTIKVMIPQIRGQTAIEGLLRQLTEVDGVQTTQPILEWKTV